VRLASDVGRTIGREPRGENPSIPGSPSGEVVDLRRVDPAAVASLTRHFEFSPVPFAVTEGPAHALVYANAAFRRVHAAREIAISPHSSDSAQPTNNLVTLLDRVFRGAGPICDEVPAPADGGDGRWSCTVWPIGSDTAAPDGLAMELREASPEWAITRQRAVVERLLLRTLREQDAARQALEDSRRAEFLAAASRELAMSLDESATRETVKRRALPREGTWCIVDLVAADGVMRRLAVVHPDPAKQSLARMLADEREWDSDDRGGESSLTPVGGRDPSVITDTSDAALLVAAHGRENLAILRAIGFGALLVIPLVVRATVLGAITFVTPEGDPPFLPEEIALATDLADRCAIALDNARLYTETETLRVAADAANRAKAEFLGNMSHELRTPLNQIGGYAELLELGLHGPMTPRQLADLGRIRNNQQHLVTLITDILNYVRTESGRLEFNFSEVKVHGALRDVAEMLDGAIKERKLVLDGPPDDVNGVVWADADRVRQILVNLVMNGVKYSTFGSGTITLRSTVSGNAVIIEVADAGPGIPRDKLEAIFEPFVQLCLL
jgi:signal transduction histidine kinase